MLWYNNNLLFSKCEYHSTMITPNHIKNLHNITKNVRVKEGRIYQIIQSKVQDKIVKDIFNYLIAGE